MTSRHHHVSCMLLAVFLLPLGALAAPQANLELRDGWQVQSSSKVTEKGDVLSTAKFSPQGWYRTAVPATVLTVLVNNQVYPDPYYGTNLRAIPGTSYPIGVNYSNLPMPADSPFRVPWWYRTEYDVPAEFRGKEVWLDFGGINFRANIWLNGRQLGAADRVAGMWRLWEFNVTDAIAAGGKNVLAVEVFPPTPNDLAITFVDWNPLPPDKDMGLWRGVSLTTSGPAALRYPQVVTHFASPSLDVARLTVNALVTNATPYVVKGTLKGQIESLRFEQPVELAAHESKTVSFTPEKYPQLNISNPRVWWPAELGEQPLYTLDLEFEAGGQVSDRATIQFGIREITSEMTPQKSRLFKINGKNILIRGAGWSSDMLLRPRPEKEEAEIRYVKDMHLNTIRLEGKLEDDHFFETCDREGILVMAGWCCCDHWEKWKNWNAEDYSVSAESLRDQIRRLRSHACLLVWLNGSDNPPPAKVEETYIRVLKEEHWPNPYISSATQKPTTVTGDSGVKMTGPYEYVAPAYWLEDTRNGGAHGFNTETSPGPAVPPVASLRKFLPEDKLWPVNEVWDYHAGGGEFKNLKVFTAALNARYGEATSLEDYVEKAQLMTYEGERAMFEAYGRNKYTSTGVIQWMLNNAWPSMIWHLYDYYLRPAGGYFGTKKACEPLHIQYSYDDNSIVVVNSLYKEFKGLKAMAVVYNLDLSEKFSKSAEVDAGPDSSKRIFTIPKIDGLTKTYFLRLTLAHEAGKVVSRNFYWLSTQPDVSDWQATKWYFTPISTYADLTGLQTLPKVELKVMSRVEHLNGKDTSRVVVENPSPHLAFFVHLRVTKGRGGEEVLPVFWQDNYFELMPGEKREVTATYRTEDLQGASPSVEVDAWNLKK
ncbi:MAG: glycosyl hydrolase family 2 [Acidobacteriia bacterium]|nr:glycosyl hydrolase family 2 [Terriglobia bacterium]